MNITYTSRSIRVEASESGVRIANIGDNAAVGFAEEELNGVIEALMAARRLYRESPS